MLGGDFAGGVFVGAGGGFGDAVSAVIIPPGLDGAPGEVVGVAVFIMEGGGADGLVTGEVGGALGVFEGSEDSHFEVVGYTFHRQGGSYPGKRAQTDRLCVLLE